MVRCGCEGEDRQDDDRGCAEDVHEGVRDRAQREGGRLTATVAEFRPRQPALRKRRDLHAYARPRAPIELIRGALPLGLPYTALARRFAGSLRSRGSLAVLARTSTERRACETASRLRTGE